MRVQSLLAGSKDYVSFLARTLLFPFVWLWALALARKHSDTDVQAVRKVGGAMVAGVLLAGIAFFAVDSFADDAETGMYESMDTRMQSAVGESAYQEQVEIVIATNGQIEKLEERYENEPENREEIQAALDAARQTNEAAANYAAELEGNHALYEQLAPLVTAQNDAAVKRLIASSTVDPDVPSSVYEKSKMQSRSDRAFEIKDKAVADLNVWMNYLLLPGIVGVFFAPLSFALGNVLRNAWEASETVGFKPYPGGSMGFFLLFGAFGIPALFFAAWTFWDMDVRSKEGQISL